MVIVANLAPRMLRGLESNGMIVAAAVEPDGKPTLYQRADDRRPERRRDSGSR